MQTHSPTRNILFLLSMRSNLQSVCPLLRCRIDDDYGMECVTRCVAYGCPKKKSASIPRGKNRYTHVALGGCFPCPPPHTHRQTECLSWPSGITGRIQAESKTPKTPPL